MRHKAETVTRKEVVLIRTGYLKRLSVSAMLIAAMLVASPQGIVRAASSDKISYSLIGKYDSADTAAIRDIDTVAKQIRFRNHSTGKTYTLSYDNTSMIYDSRGTALSASLLEVGQIVDVTFLKSSKHITTLNVSNDAWVIENTRDHELVRGDGTARVKGEIYRIDNRTLVMADGVPALAEDVLATDNITVSGIGKEIYSVVVTGGHGYVSLSSDVVEDHSLVGAWIELDNEVIHKISPNMLLSAPEGDYNLQIIGNGASYQSEINISRNQETVVDTSNVNIEKPKEGLVTFEVVPEEAEVFVDGEKVLTGVPQSIRYGYHSLKIMADGYFTQDKYLKIGTAKSVISIELEKDESQEQDEKTENSTDDAATVSSNDAATNNQNGASPVDVSGIANSGAAPVSSNSSAPATAVNQVIEGYRIYFDLPYGAELYFDGSYIGMIPVSVTKISGTHEVILKKDGYETKSYRISIDSGKVDLNYSFPDLVRIEEKKDDSSDSVAPEDTTPTPPDKPVSGNTSGDKSSDDKKDPSDETPSDEKSSDDKPVDDGSSKKDATDGSAPSEDSAPVTGDPDTKEDEGTKEEEPKPDDDPSDEKPSDDDDNKDPKDKETSKDKTDKSDKKKGE